MDKLNFDMAIVFTVLLVNIGLALSAAILLHPLPAMAVEMSGDRDATAVSEAASGDLIWVSQVGDHIHRLSQEGAIPRSRILEEVSGLWHGRIARWQIDSPRTADALVEKLFALQIDHITSLLNDPAPQQDASSTGLDRHLDETTRAIDQLTNLSPLVLAARDSIRSSMLVVSSVGCGCELARCANMAKLFDSMHSDSLIGPIAMIDLMQIPPLEELLGQVTIPYWVLFGENGDAATLIEGASDAEDARASILSWLGTPQVESGREE